MGTVARQTEQLPHVPAYKPALHRDGPQNGTYQGFPPYARTITRFSAILRLSVFSENVIAFSENIYILNDSTPI